MAARRSGKNPLMRSSFKRGHFLHVVGSLLARLCHPAAVHRAPTSHSMNALAVAAGVDITAKAPVRRPRVIAGPLHVTHALSLHAVPSRHIRAHWCAVVGAVAL